MNLLVPGCYVFMNTIELKLKAMPANENTWISTMGDQIIEYALRLTMSLYVSAKVIIIIVTVIQTNKVLIN